jgi:hypothetical protein
MPFLFKAMTTRFYHWLGEEGGISAFHGNNLVMSLGSPMVNVNISLQELQEFICTLEKASDEEPNAVQQFALDAIRHVFEAALQHHEKDHEALVEEAPTGADLEEYLLSYARAIKEGAL